MTGYEIGKDDPFAVEETRRRSLALSCVGPNNAVPFRLFIL